MDGRVGGGRGIGACDVASEGGGLRGVRGNIIGVCSVEEGAVEHCTVFIEKLHRVSLPHESVRNALVGLTSDIGGGRAAAVGNTMTRAWCKCDDVYR